MTDPTTAPGADTVRSAVTVVDLALRACSAYGRDDLGRRLGSVRATLDEPGLHIVVVGEFKKGKSSLVNALVGATVCPVDDDTATAVPTYIRHGAVVEAELLRDGETVTRQPIPIEDVRRYVVDAGQGGADGPVAGVQIRLPRPMLASGLVIVDTPGVGGLGSAHAAASLAAISMADAVVFVTDASQELTRAELDFLRQARDLCSTVICVMTKIDFFPRWRTIRDLDERHLSAVAEIPLLPVSSALRTRAAQQNDAVLNSESGFPALVEFVGQRVAGGGLNEVAASAAAEVIAVCRQIETQFLAEKAALADPAAAAAAITRATAAKERAERLRTSVARWQITLNDGLADLTANVDHDMRGRIRQVIQEADAAIEDADPADTWPQVEAWLRSRLSQEVLINYTLLRRSADELSRTVGDHFQEASGEIFSELEIYNPLPMLGTVRMDSDLELERQGVVMQAWGLMRQSYGGILMFTMLPHLLLSAATVAAASVVVTPIAVGIGVVMGRKGMQEEKKRRLQMRQGQARNAVRKYCDEITFALGKDSRDTVRRVQRQLRDFYGTRAEELNRSSAEALRSAQAALQDTEAQRKAKIRNLDSELARLEELRLRAGAVRG